MDNFSVNDTAINLARLLLAVTMVFTIPMENFVARYTLQELFIHPKTTTNVQHVFLTLLYVLSQPNFSFQLRVSCVI